MMVKALLRPIPGVRQLSLLRQRVSFGGSASFWERRYASGGWSGPGSYGELGRGKAAFLNSFVADRQIESVIEFGCGDGNQLLLAEYPKYIGLDVSKSAVDICIGKFNNDDSKSFFLYDGRRYVDRCGAMKAELALSLDVIYHLVEDEIFEIYMRHLFAAADRYVIIYATNGGIRDDAPHVTHRAFTSWVDDNCAEWQLEGVAVGPDSGPRRADFHVFRRVGFSV